MIHSSTAGKIGFPTVTELADSACCLFQRQNTVPIRQQSVEARPAIENATLIMLSCQQSSRRGAFVSPTRRHRFKETGCGSVTTTNTRTKWPSFPTRNDVFGPYKSFFPSIRTKKLWFLPDRMPVLSLFAVQRPFAHHQRRN